MKEYIVLVAVSAIVAAFADVLAPDKWRGYTRVIMGFLLLSVLISPLAKLKNVEILSDSETFSVSDAAVKEEVAEELTKRVETDICERILDEFGERVEAEVELLADKDHRIQGVKKICLTGRNVPKNVSDRLKEVYGCDSVEIKFK